MYTLLTFHCISSSPYFLLYISTPFPSPLPLHFLLPSVSPYPAYPSPPSIYLSPPSSIFSSLLYSLPLTALTFTLLSPLTFYLSSPFTYPFTCLYLPFPLHSSLLTLSSTSPHPPLLSPSLSFLSLHSPFTCLLSLRYLHLLLAPLSHLSFFGAFLPDAAPGKPAHRPPCLRSVLW